MRAIARPTSAEPVNATPSTGASTSARPVAGPPWITFSTPGGQPGGDARSRPRIAPVQGVSSEGLSTTLLPAISAAAAMLTASAAGKLNGAITANTPYGRSTSVLRSPSTKLSSGRS